MTREETGDKELFVGGGIQELGAGEFQYSLEIRREKKRIQKLEEENRRRILRLAQQEKLEKDKRRNGR